MKSHVRHLPPKMRVVGDPFVRQEFKSHIKETDPRFMQGFIEKWIDYYKMLESAKSVEDIGQSIDKNSDQMLSQEQKDTLKKLKESLK